MQKLNQLGTKSACLDASSLPPTNKSSASNNLIFPTSSINNPSNPFFLPHCSPNYYFNQSTPFYFLRQQNQQFTSSASTQNAAGTSTNASAYESSQLNQTPPTNENYYPSSMFGQEPILNSSTTVAHQLNSPNASFQINSPNHSSSSYLNEDQPTSQPYTAYSSLSNSHHHSNAHHSSSAVLNSYYNSTNNAFPSNVNELANSRLMNNFISDNYSVNSLVSKNSSVYSSNSATSHLNQFKQNASQKASLMPKLSAHQQNDSYPGGIQAGGDYVVKKTTVYNNLSNFNNFNNLNNLNSFNNNLDHNLDLIKSSINYFNEQQYHQCNENGSSGIDIKPKLTSFYGDINGIRNPLLFGLAKNCSAQSEHHNSSGNELSSSALANYTPNKLIHSLNSTGSTCSTMSSPTLSN